MTSWRGQVGLLFIVCIGLLGPAGQGPLAGDTAPTEAANLEAVCIPWVSTIPLKASAEVRRVDDTVCLSGEIDPAAAVRLQAALDEIPPERPIVLVVRSAGGMVLSGLDMAEALAPRRVTTVVSSICASSCANYLFIAGDRRIIAPDAVLVFHGGMSPGHLARVRERLASERSKRRPDPGRVAELERGLAAATQGPARQEAVLRGAGVDARFFELFDDINARPRRTWSPDCAARPRTAMLVFSTAFLRRTGLVLENHGPADRAELAALLKRRRSDGLACFWE